MRVRSKVWAELFDPEPLRASVCTRERRERIERDEREGREEREREEKEERERSERNICAFT